MSKSLYTLSKPSIEYLCGLIRELSKVSEGIDDLNLRSDGTFSSVRIDALLKALKTDCNDYTDKLVSNLSRLKLKIVTDEADITESNTMYLYKPDGTTSYNQYVVIEGNKVLLGTCDIDMADYYTITETDNKFALKTTTDTLTTEVTNIKSDLTTHTDDTDIHITANERTKWNDATNEEKVKDIIDSEMTTKGVCTTKVANISNKEITSALDTTKATINSIRYSVKNGMCYVRIVNLKPLLTCDATVILPIGTLPNADDEYYYASVNTWDDTTGSSVLLRADKDGSLKLWCNVNNLNKAHYGMFSYPVAES